MRRTLVLVYLLIAPCFLNSMEKHDQESVAAIRSKFVGLSVVIQALPALVTLSGSEELAEAKNELLEIIKTAYRVSAIFPEKIEQYLIVTTGIDAWNHYQSVNDIEKIYEIIRELTSRTRKLADDAHRRRWGD